MTSPNILGQLSALHELQQQLLESASESEAARQFHPQLASLNWYFGRGVYLELYWLRERLEGDGDLGQRVSHLFEPGELSLQAQCQQLPPTSHLIQWASDIRDEHLRRLATPGVLPDHPFITNDRLQWFLLQEQAKIYESMLEVLNQRSLHIRDTGHVCTHPLVAAEPVWQTREISQGHYRIGARDEPKAYDNELPPQAVELSSYRIALTPVSNAQYLAFMQASGYENASLWSDEGRHWLQENSTSHPEYWRRDPSGNWYESAINGNSDLPADEPVAGINRFEAEAYTQWASQLGAEYEGAVLQHEYQWEVAARSGVLQQTGRVWEWCSTPFHTYPEFQPFPDERQISLPNGSILRGASMHTQRVIRRSSFRHWADPSDHFHFSGMRMVFPPKHEWS
ncbi:MAG: formylglycine-generating enzyme family protein [Candidatus Thiodiazotropha sp. (ex Monitilora ramsayi)]|nr:formylglycine-generating enzyme family protein [Candidatus Thiodiazotropha sp. (ex Monitilora ramsayi)]